MASKIAEDNIYDKTYFSISVPGPKWDVQSQSYSLVSGTIMQKSFNQPIIKNPEDYYLTVSDLSIPTGNIPVFIFQPITPGGQELIYNVTLEYNGNSSTVNLIWDSPNINPQGYQSFPYGVYNYNVICDCINQAFVQAYVNVGPPPESYPPFIAYNADKQRFIMYAQANYYSVDRSGNAAAPTSDLIKIFVNAPLSIFFQGMPQLVNNYQSQILMLNINTSNWISFPFVQDLLINEQQYSCLSTLRPVRSIQIISNTLPIKKENIPSIEQNKVTSFVSSIGLLKDIPYASADPYYLIFHQDGPYQLINMYNRTPINKIDIDIIWIDRDGQPHPLEIPYDQTVSIRFCFLKKKGFTS